MGMSQKQEAGAGVSWPAVPDLAALKTAARAAIVIPAVFAFADKVIGQPQTSIFAAFGSFALLVLVEITGPPPTRFLAYLGLACVGATFITLGTLCSRNPWLGAAAMAIVGFGTLFSGLISGYFAAAATGPAGPTAALASLPDELDWLLSFITPSAELPALEFACTEDAEAMTAAAAVVRASADRLEGRDGRPDFGRLDAARDAVAHALVRRLPGLPPETPAGDVPQALEAPFRIRAATYSARQVAGYALLTTGADVPELDRRDLAQPPPALAALEATEKLAVEHASVRSVWFQ